MHITALENRTAVMAKLHEALFDYYIIKPLINDPMITDIKLCGPNDITVRIGGKTYASNLSFMDEDDYSRFIIMVAIKNNRQIDVAQQEFHDHSHPLYRMRITITANYISSSGNAYMAIRKHSKEKPMDDYFLKAGMFNEVVRDYLADCALHSKAVLFAGATGAGKTALANWFLEQHEKSAAILIIQETDELFSDRKGIMFENVMMHPQEGQQYCPLEALGRLALVTSSNVFGIGEVKGPEIASAITLAGSGCRIFMTIHADSAESVLTKCANLVRKNAAYQGIASDQINRELLAFQTIVFLKDYKVDEILEVAGYDSMSGEFAYRHIYKREEESKTNGREIQL
jgi:Flp pilus assembly CpaF family ATPase